MIFPEVPEITTVKVPDGVPGIGCTGGLLVEPPVPPHASITQAKEKKVINPQSALSPRIFCPRALAI